MRFHTLLLRQQQQQQQTLPMKRRLSCLMPATLTTRKCGARQRLLYAGHPICEEYRLPTASYCKARAMPNDLRLRSCLIAAWVEVEGEGDIRKALPECDAACSIGRGCHRLDKERGDAWDEEEERAYAAG